MDMANMAAQQLPQKTTSHRGVFVHALHKSASMFLFEFFGNLSRERGFEFYSANSDPPREFDGQTASLNLCCCPIRTFEVEPVADSNLRQRRIFHVRDPRDMLVSEYFSFGWRHEAENPDLSQRRLSIQEMTVDQYALQQPEFSRWSLEQKFRPLLERISSGVSSQQHDIVVKYETMVTQFPSWVAEVIKPFEFRLPRIAVGRLAWKYRNDFRPSTEPGAHKRRIIPGDFRDKLKPETIRKLNERFADVLQAFDYED